MLYALIHCHIKPEYIDAFKAASMENARNSILEPGCLRFDVIQQDEDPTRFVLVEIYRTADDPARHRETAHYLTWRDATAEMFVEPRTGVKYHNVFPDDAGLEK